MVLLMVSHSLIHDFDVRLNGKMVYDCNDANHCVNIKNLLNIVQDMLNRQQQMSFSIWIQTDTLKNDRLEDNYNKGFAVRKALLGLSVVVNTEIPLNRYSFFEALMDELLPSTRLELNLQIESDTILIWQAGLIVV